MKSIFYLAFAFALTTSFCAVLFRGDWPLAILQQHVSAPPPSPESINSSISPELVEVILRGLAKEPEDRFPSAIALTTALAKALNVPLPERPRQPISLPGFSNLPESSEDLQKFVPLKKPVAYIEEHALLPPAMPPTFIYTPSSRVSAVVGKVPENSTELAPVSTFRSWRLPTPVRQHRRRRILIVSMALLIVAVVSSGLVALFVFSPTNIVGHAFFTSSGAASGADNMGINDTFLVNLSNVPMPQSGNTYYAWLLPDQNQSEASPRALGTLAVTNGVATLPLPYVDPQHDNLLIYYSRFLVTEEPKSPAPLDPSLDKATWRYYAEIPQNPPLKNCTVVISQLNVLCHLRHLLSGDPELALINLPGGLNYWFLNNVKEIQVWAVSPSRSSNWRLRMSHAIDAHREIDMMPTIMQY